MSDRDWGVLRNLAEKAGIEEWQPYFTIHGDPFVVPVSMPYPSSVVANINTAPDDYGKARCEFIAAASPGVVKELIEENEKLRAALGYISSPTMGLPAGADAYVFAAAGGATEYNARYALQICIRTARAALAAAVVPTTETSE